MIELHPERTEEFDARKIYAHNKPATCVGDVVYVVLYGFSAYDRPPVDGGFHSLDLIFHNEKDAAAYLNEICAEFYYDNYLKEFVWLSDSPYKSDIVMRFVIRKYDVH